MAHMGEEQQIQLNHGIDQWPPPGAALVLALQWLVVLVPGLLVLGDVLAMSLGLSPAQRVEFMQRLLLLMAAVQAVQVLWGHRLPGMVGPSAVMLVGMLATLSGGWADVRGAVCLGGVLMAGLGALGLAERLARLYTPPVLASTLLLIPISLAPTMRDQLFDPNTAGAAVGGSFLFGVGLVVAVLGVQRRVGGLAGNAMLLIGLAIGTAAYHLLGLGPAPQWQAAAAWGAPPLGWPELGFSWPTALSFCLFYLALISNELGTVETLVHILRPEQHWRRVNRAVLVGGLGGVASGLLGVVGPVTYSVSPGAVLASRSASRWTLLLMAAMVAALGLWPGGLALFNLVPRPVVGAVLLTLMTNTVYAAINVLLADGKPLSVRQGLVVGASLTTGLVVSFIPPEAAQTLHPWLRPILGNGFMAGLALAFFMEHVVLRPQRGEQ